VFQQGIWGHGSGLRTLDPACMESPALSLAREAAGEVGADGYLGGEVGSGEVPEGGLVVVVCGGEAVLGPETVADGQGHDDGAGLMAERVVRARGRREVREAAAVDVNDHGPRRGLCLGGRRRGGEVDAGSHAGGSADGDVDGATERTPSASGRAGLAGAWRSTSSENRERLMVPSRPCLERPELQPHRPRDRPHAKTNRYGGIMPYYVFWWEGKIV
jgi:hypothetical protein